MAKKTYYSDNAPLFMPVHSKGRIVTIKFEKNIFGKGVFITSDEELQSEIEGKQSYGTAIRLISVSGDEQPKKESNKVVSTNEPQQDIVAKEYPEATTVQTARNILVREFGVKFRDSDTKEKVLAQAKEHNISFPNLK